MSEIKKINDLYWSCAAIRSLQSNNMNTFSYSIYHIHDNERIKRLNEIYTEYVKGNETIINAVRKYTSPIPIIFT